MDVMGSQMNEIQDEEQNLAYAAGTSSSAQASPELRDGVPSSSKFASGCRLSMFD